MYKLTFRSPFGETKTFKIEDNNFNIVNEKLENNKIIVLGGESFKTQYFVSMCRIKEENTLKLPEVQLTEEERLKNCEKLRKMKDFYFKKINNLIK